jgi:hypothetical protein
MALNFSHTKYYEHRDEKSTSHQQPMMPDVQCHTQESGSQKEFKPHYLVNKQ